MSYETSQANLKFLKSQYAEAARRTVFFVGAGCSTEVGLPNWKQLAGELYQQLDAATPSSALNGDLLTKYHEIEEAYSIEDYWRMFELVEENWRQIYEDFLNEIFGNDRMDKMQVPTVYSKIWKMRNVGQVLTLNIDGLMAKAYDQTVHGIGPKLLEFTGTTIADSRNYFFRNHPTLLHLHGVYTMRSSWVMNGNERDRLFSNMQSGSYRAFLRSIFEGYNVVFVGVNIRDIAVSPIIEETAQSKLLQNHFWLTPSVTTEDYKWAQANGVRVINYTPDFDSKGNRVDSTTLCSILDDVESFKSFDQSAILPKLPKSCADIFPKKDELLVESTQNRLNARKLLNEKIESIGCEHGFDSKVMEGFIGENLVPIELVSILSTGAGYEILEDAKISTEISSSNSSNVWMATRDGATTYCAIKALSGQAFKDRIERESFRRGVESLYYLNKANRPVAPRFMFHTNVPLAVAMEFIQGMSLSELFEYDSTLIQNSWILVFTKICEALLVCHRSEGGVLHRDLKPKNILFENVNFGYDAEDLGAAGVRLINFDMSWHKLSSGNSKAVAADEVGYYAPEQRVSSNADSPRTAKTDVYMLGMILLFLLSGSPPPEGGSKLEKWEEYVQSKVGSKVRNKLIAARISRLLIGMTREIPDHRPDLSNILTDIEILEHALTNS